MINSLKKLQKKWSLRKEKKKKKKKKRKKNLSPSLSPLLRASKSDTHTHTHTHTRTHAHILLRNIMQPPQTPSRDRFIANRSAIDLDVARYALDSSANNNRGGGRDDDDDDDDDADDNHRGGGGGGGGTHVVASPSKEAYKKSLASNYSVSTGGGGAGSGDNGNSKILAFKSKAPAPPSGMENAAREMYTSNIHVGGGVSKGNGGNGGGKKQFRHIPQAPERILDAPELVDDYYLNLIDWSSQNSIAVALGCTVYLWNAGTGAIDQLMQTDVEYDEEDYVTSVNWAPDGKHIAVGTNNAEVQIWDASRARKVRTLKGHDARVGALAWNGTQLATGSRDTTVKTHDVRIREHCTNTFTFHEQEVCGLKWSPSGTQLASGGNDNALHIYDAQSLSNGTYRHKLVAHQAAVKALAWCPWQANVLASGGGTADRCIKFWNANTGMMTNSVDTHSQVCALQWNTHERELLSSHGYSQNQLCLWKYPTMTKIAEFTGHTARVLHMAQSPDGTTVVSAAADETLRFWKCFAENNSDSKKAAKDAANAERSVLKRFNFR